jgi:hypothetical protein
MDPIDQLLTHIAQQHLRIDTLETRKLRCQDFHDLPVWCLRDALEAAFNAGVEEGRKQAQPQARKATALDPTNG